MNSTASDNKANTKPLTYAQSGVDTNAGNELVNQIKPLAASTGRPGSDGSIGGFGGVFSLAEAGYHALSPTIVSAIDGVGTKLLLAQAVATPAQSDTAGSDSAKDSKVAMAAYKSVGIDLVAMNVNDLVVQGAAPFSFLDYYACGRLHVPSAVAFVSGVADGCRQSGCVLSGGETAEMPGLYRGRDFDGAGCAIGAIAAGRRVLPHREAMTEGDVLLGLVSSGCHSNGFSLIRKIVERSGLKYSDAAPWDQKTTLGEALLTPTRIYVKSLLSVLRDADGQEQIKGMAHITGGGITENVPRMLPKHLKAHMYATAWPFLHVFRWLKREGRVEAKEMAKTFNCGLGMVCVVEDGRVNEVTWALEETGEKVYKVGKLVPRAEGEEGCVVDNLWEWK